MAEPGATDPLPTEKLLEWVQSLGFGGLLGAGAAGFFYGWKRQWFGTLDFYQVVLLGGMAGTGLHQAIQAAVNSIVRPVLNFVAFYERLGRVLFLRQIRLIDPQQADVIIRQLILRGVLGETPLPGEQKGGPPELPPDT